MRRVAFAVAMILLAYSHNSIANGVYADRGFKIAIVEKGWLSVIDVLELDMKSTTSEKIYEFNEAYVSVSCPQFIDSKKLLFAENDRRNNRGLLIIKDLDDGELEKLYEGRIVESPRISLDLSKVLFMVLNDANDYGLMLYDMKNKTSSKILETGVFAAGAYNFNISWVGDSNHMLYSNVNGEIYMLDIVSGEKKYITNGYDPDCSEDGKMILYKKSKYKPYTPYVYNIKDGSEYKVKGSSIYNVKWLADGRLEIIQSASSIFNMDEWRKNLLISDGEKKVKVFEYRGYEY